MVGEVFNLAGAECLINSKLYYNEVFRAFLPPRRGDMSIEACVIATRVRYKFRLFEL